jgi:hypothetical protein
VRSGSRVRDATRSTPSRFGKSGKEPVGRADQPAKRPIARNFA